MTSVAPGVAGGEESGGELNVAPMGPVVNPGMTAFVFRPFRTSTTYRNLKATGEGVFHVTDDALLIARGAIGTLDVAALPTRPAEAVRGVVLTGACRYYELRVTELNDREERTTIRAAVAGAGWLRDFVGFHRARHAVIEAAILATRLHLTGKPSVLAEYDRLRVTIDKKGTETEHLAISELRSYVERWEPQTPG
jgi:hypothetical protein